MNEKSKSKKQEKKRKKNKVEKRKRGPKGVLFYKPQPRWAQKLIFTYIRTVKRNRNEIEAPKKNHILSTHERK